MKHFHFLLFFFIPFVVFAEGRRVALVIGNASYDRESGFNALKTPLHDANAMAEQLTALGFELTFGKAVLDANKETMVKAVEQFASDCQGADMALFYYSGHGAVYRGKHNLLLPVHEEFTRANIKTKSFELSDIEYVLEDLKGCQAKIIILDACRNNPFTNVFGKEGSGDVNEGLLRNKPAEGTIVYYATREGQTASQDVGESKYSIFTEAWLNALQENPNRELNDLFFDIKDYVSKKTKNAQLPTQEGTIKGSILGNMNNSFETNERISTNHADLLSKLRMENDSLRIMLGDTEEEANRVPYEYKDFIVNGVSFRMIRVEGGTFTMGKQPDTFFQSNYKQQSHEETLATFYIGETEVTQALWKIVMSNNPSRRKGSSIPVNNASYKNICEFISKLNMLTGKKFRLPTEAEWEFAARGGRLQENFLYSGSNNIDEVAWYEKNSGSKDFAVHKVKQKLPNGLGIYDMSGNLYEICQDIDEEYSASNGWKAHICRGGSYWESEKYCLLSARSHEGKLTQDSYGIRLVLSEY